MNEEKQGENALRLSRAFFSRGMPDDFKRVFIKVIMCTPCLPYDQKCFLCDQIQNYENIGDFGRKEILDVIDELRLFVTTPENKISA
jgi:hypothetical protein